MKSINEIERFLAQLREKNAAIHAPCISEATAHELRSLLSASRPQQILEVGTCHGYSAILMALQLRMWDVQITTIEFSAPSYEQACANIAACELQQHVHVQFGDALLMLPMLPNHRFDFAFIDGEKRSTLAFVQRAWPKLKSGATLVVDDVLKYREKMQDFWQWVETEDITHRIVPTEAGDALMILQRE